MISEKRKKSIKEWRLKNKERILLYQRQYYAKNKRKYRRYKGADNPTTANAKMGRFFEKRALEMFPDSIDINNIYSQSSFDVQWGEHKIEVKSRNLTKSIKKWRFTRFKNKSEATHVLLFCLADKKVKRVIFMPYNGQKSIDVSNTNLKEFEVVCTTNS